MGIKAVYLTFTSRLLKRRVISLIRRGTASSGKNHLIEQVLALFPPGSIIRMTGSSAKVMPYWGGDDPDFLKHKALYVPEASSLLARDGKETEQAGMIRSAISENRIDYPVVVLQGNGLPPITRQIVKHGPIVFVVTSARNNVEPEMNSRLAPADADESIAQSSMVMTYAFDGAGGLLDPTAAEEAEVELLRDFQLWLEDGGPYDVVVPFAPHVRAAFSRTPIAVRIRRDINILIAGVAACAILHKAQREVDARGRILATLVDYEHAWKAFNPGVSTFHNPQQAPGVIALVRVLEGLIEKARKAKAAASDYRLRDNPDVWSPVDASFDGSSVKATARQLASLLGLASMDTVSSRMGDAKLAGAVVCVNESDPHNVPRRYEVKISSKDLARKGALPVFPPPAEVVRLMNDPAAYERARAAILAEVAKGETEPKELTPYDPDGVPF